MCLLQARSGTHGYVRRATFLAFEHAGFHRAPATRARRIPHNRDNDDADRGANTRARSIRHQRQDDGRNSGPATRARSIPRIRRPSRRGRGPSHAREEHPSCSASSKVWSWAQPRARGASTSVAVAHGWRRYRPVGQSLDPSRCRRRDRRVTRPVRPSPEGRAVTQRSRWDSPRARPPPARPSPRRCAGPPR